MSKGMAPKSLKLIGVVFATAVVVFAISRGIRTNVPLSSTKPTSGGSASVSPVTTADAMEKNSLGLKYEQGQGVPKDYGLAASFYRKAADQGLSDAQDNLGRMYEYGEGVPHDYTSAMMWYRKAADQGLASAQYNVGRMYESGRGELRDYVQAVYWYSKAADQGVAAAQRSLGMVFTAAIGVPQDNVQGIKWLILAKENGATDVDPILDYREKQATPMELEQAKKIAHEWSVAYHQNSAPSLALAKGQTTDTAQSQASVELNQVDKIYRAGEVGNFYFLHSDGTVVSPQTNFASTPENSCGDPRPVRDKSGKWGYFGSQGMAIPIQFDDATCFSEDGFAKVGIRGATGIIDRSGTWIVPLQNSVILISQNEGRILFARQWENDSSVNSTSTAYGFADTNGQTVIPANLNAGMPFTEGLAGVSLPNTIGIGYINKQGTLVIPWSYGEARPFKEGLAAVRPAFRNKFGYIDHTGARPIDVRFDNAMSFNEGLAAVKENGKWGFINKQGEYVIKPIYQNAESFYGGLARVSMDGKHIYIDRNGNEKFPG